MTPGSRFRTRVLVGLALLGAVLAASAPFMRFRHRRPLTRTAPVEMEWAPSFPFESTADAILPISGIVKRTDWLWQPMGYAPVCGSSYYNWTRRVTYCDGREENFSNAGNYCVWDGLSDYCRGLWYYLDASACSFKPGPPPGSTDAGASDCPVDEPCNCRTGNCPNGCVGAPVSVSRLALTYRVNVFPLGRGGFPANFELQYAGQQTYLGSKAAAEIGVRWSHSLSPSITIHTTAPQTARVVTEDGSTLAFTLSGSAWIADDSRVETLTVTSGSGCSGTISLKDPDTEYVFGQFCAGTSIAEGRIQRLNRQNGDFETFSPDSNGNIGSVQNRLGQTVVLNHLADGELQSVIAPTGEKFNLALDISSRLLGSVTLAGASTPLHTMKYATSHGGSYFALGSALDGNLHRDHGWTYGWGPADTGAIEVASEAGPGTPGVLSGNTLYFAEPLATNETDVVFTAADGTSKTNQYFFASPFADQSRSNLTGRNLLGACPGCGAGTGSTNFWTTAGDEASIRSTQTPNGFWTVYEDFNHAAVASYAYSLGRPLVINEGCDSPSNCTSGRRSSYTYRGTSSDVASTTRPSAVVSATVTDSREFDGTSARETKNHHQGWTAATLSGSLDILATRTTKTSYLAGGVDVSQIDGPYSGTAEPPGDNSAPKTVFVYYAPTDVDACSGATLSVNTNAGLVKTVARFIDATNALTTTYCSYDFSARPRKIKNPDGKTTQMAYDFRGNVKQSIIDVGGLNLTTEFTYDNAGNLLQVLLPRSTSNGRTGYKYLYDDADRLTDLKHGYLNGSTFTSLESMHYLYDAWGNRTETDYQDATGATIVSEGSKYDAFNRLVELARPAGSAFKSTFAYDAEGHLTSVADAQADTVFYGNQADLSKYDRFGKIGLVRQQICAHPATAPNGACSNPPTADVAYAYDPALQLSQVAVKNTTGATLTTTNYVTDDFGSVVQVASPDSGTAKYLYDAQGRLFQTQDARGKKFQYAYDRLGRVLSKTNITATAAVELTWCYDGFDLACGFTNSARSAGRLTAVKDKAGKLQDFYDTAGRLTSEVRSFTGGGTFTTSWQLDANGSATSTTYPDGYVLPRTFDAADHETDVGSLPGVLSQISWYPFGAVKSWYAILPGGNTHSVIEDGGGRVTETNDSIFGATPSSLVMTYGYANDGNVSKIPSTIATPNILHDSLSRIAQDRRTPSGIIPSSATTFTYNDAGNRTAHDASGYVYAASTDRLTSGDGNSYGYDAAGNVTSRGSKALTVADDGTVIGISSVTYTRDSQNRRLLKAGTNAATFHYSATGELLEWSGQCTASHIDHENYVYVGGRRLAVIATRTNYGNSACTTGPSLQVRDTLSYTADKMDQPRRVWSQSRNRIIWSADFDAFGNPIGTIDQDPDNDGVSYSVPFRLPGQYALDSADGGPTTTAGGLVENWNRIYDSVTGRYLERDAFPSTRFDPYSYVGNGPFSESDSTGLLGDGFTVGAPTTYYQGPGQRDPYNDPCGWPYKIFGACDPAPKPPIPGYPRPTTGKKPYPDDFDPFKDPPVCDLKPKPEGGAKPPPNCTITCFNATNIWVWNKQGEAADKPTCEQTLPPRVLDYLTKSWPELRAVRCEGVWSPGGRN